MSGRSMPGRPVLLPGQGRQQSPDRADLCPDTALHAALAMRHEMTGSVVGTAHVGDTRARAVGVAWHRTRGRFRSLVHARSKILHVVTQFNEQPERPIDA